MWIRNNFREYKASSMTVCFMVKINFTKRESWSELFIDWFPKSTNHASKRRVFTKVPFMTDFNNLYIHFLLENIYLGFSHAFKCVTCVLGACTGQKKGVWSPSVELKLWNFENCCVVVWNYRLGSAAKKRYYKLLIHLSIH